MNRKILFWPLAAMLLTACEKTLEVGEDVFPTEQVKNSLLKVRTRSGGSSHFSGDGDDEDKVSRTNEGENE